MKKYVVKLRFWLRAFDSTVISAATDAEAFHLAKAAACHMMHWHGHPEEIDMEGRREGLLSYVDTVDGAREELAEGIVFDGDRPLHPEARRLVQKVAVLDPNVDAAQAQELLRTLIAEARSVPTDAAALPSDPPVQSRPWSVDQVYEYRGRPEGFRVDVVDEAGIVHMLDPRFELRNHSPTGFSWGYSGSGAAQLALAILCHALALRRTRRRPLSGVQGRRRLAVRPESALAPDHRRRARLGAEASKRHPVRRRRLIPTL